MILTKKYKKTAAREKASGRPAAGPVMILREDGLSVYNHVV